MAIHARSIVWADYTGRTRLTALKTNADPTTLLAQLQALSNAIIAQYWGDVIAGPVGSATNAEYLAVSQSAALKFQTMAGTWLNVTVPSPSLTIFLTDNQTVDSTNAAVIAFVSGALGVLCDAGGNVAAVFVGGMLSPDRNDLAPIV